MHFEIEIIEILQRAPDIKSLRFRRPQEFNYLAGQFISITLGSGSDQMTKPFTISCSPTERFLEITKRLTGHPFSNALDSLKVGDMVSINGPYGSFTFQEEYDKIGMLSGGIGITPLRSMIRYSIDKKLRTSIILLCSNSRENDIAFGDELEEMQRQNPNIKVINTITRPGPGWTGIAGRINTEMVKTFVPDYLERIFYISGPPKMVDAMISMLELLNVPGKQIKREYFTGYE